MNSRHLQLYITAESLCSYFDDKQSRNLVPDPDISLNMPVYNQLIQHGFRRSGSHCYRPHCDDCGACLPSRIPVRLFKPNRSQRRCLKTNQELKLVTVNAEYSEEYFELYSRYLNSRHIDGSMAYPEQSDFSQFLFCNWSDTQFLEIRQHDGSQDRLIAVAVTDITSTGVSAVYSFFDPELANRSLGTYCILKQIEYADKLGLEYVYLGYWIENHPKMHYKCNFRPMEIFRGGNWIPLTDSEK